MLSYDTWMLVLAAAAALTLPFTVISTVIDVLTYLRGAPQEQGAVACAARLTRRLPRRVLITGFLVAASIFGLIFSTHNLVQGPRGIEGPPGPRGPAGPPGKAVTLSPQINMVLSVVSALAKLRILEEDFQKFEKSAKMYSGSATTCLNEQENPPNFRFNRMNSCEMVRRSARDIEKITEISFGKKMDMEKTPNFDLNPFCCITVNIKEPLTTTANERIQVAANRIANQVRTGQNTIVLIRSMYFASINQNLAIINNFVKK